MATAGKNSYFSLDNSSGTLVDLTAKTTSIDFPRSFETGETSTMGSVAKTYIATKSDSSLSVEFIWDTTLDAQLNSVFDGRELTFNYGPAGNTAGYIKKSGECILTEIGTPSEQGGVITCSASFQCTGAVTSGTF